jgi:hypothetical protein
VIKNESELEERFASWALSTVQRLRRTVGFGFIILTAVSITVHLWINNEPGAVGPKQRAALAFIQAAACFLLALLTPKASISALARRKGINESDLATARIACKRIQIFVVAAYLAWAIYYLITGLSLYYLPDKALLTLFDRTFLVTFNTLPSLLLFWLYIELAEFTVDEPYPRDAERKIKTGVVNVSARSNNAAFLRVFSIGVFALTIAPVWYAFGSGKEEIISAFDGIASCLNGVTLALVVGRLGSKRVDPGSLTLGLLYFYAVIQPTAASFYNNSGVQLLATTIALPLKALLWLVFVWAFTTGTLSEYVHDIRVLLTRQHKDTQSEMQQENTS